MIGGGPETFDYAAKVTKKHGTVVALSCADEDVGLAFLRMKRWGTDFLVVDLRLSDSTGRTSFSGT